MFIDVTDQTFDPIGVAQYKATITINIQSLQDK